MFNLYLRDTTNVTDDDDDAKLHVQSLQQLDVISRTFFLLLSDAPELLFIAIM